MAKRINYKNSTYGYLKHQIRQDILHAPKLMPQMRAEIARVFQVANRRIQNIESTGEFSPAVAALNKGDISNYSKFFISGLDDTTLKMEYGKAITFLQQPTSTASGVRQYTQHIKDAYELTDHEYDLMRYEITGKLNSLKDSDFVEHYLMKYKDFTGEIEQTAQGIAGIIESESYSIQRAIDDEILDTTLELLADFKKRNALELKNIINKLDELGEL